MTAKGVKGDWQSYERAICDDCETDNHLASVSIPCGLVLTPLDVRGYGVHNRLRCVFLHGGAVASLSKELRGIAPS